MKKILLGAFSVVSIAGLVACGAAPDEVSQTVDGEAPMETEAAPTMTDETPMDSEMSVETPTTMDTESVEGAAMSDSELEAAIEDNLATLYPDTQFEVTSESGVVIIAGDIPTQEEADYIADWVSEINGVTDVEVMPSEAETMP